MKALTLTTNNKQALLALCQVNEIIRQRVISTLKQAKRERVELDRLAILSNKTALEMFGFLAD